MPAGLYLGWNEVGTNLQAKEKLDEKESKVTECGMIPEENTGPKLGRVCLAFERWKKEPFSDTEGMKKRQRTLELKMREKKNSSFL